jgi:hypothetical protein
MDTSSSQPRKITMQLPQALVEAMKAQAQKHRRSFTGEVVWALQQYLAEQEREEKQRI